MEKKNVTIEVEIPSGVQARLDGKKLTVKGEKGEVSKSLNHPKILINLDGNKLVMQTITNRREENNLLRTFKAHVSNLIKGATEGVEYKLKVCSGHFPMNISVANNELVIKNFLGEKVPRKLKLKNGVSVKLDGSVITVDGVDLELVSQTAADIEQLSRRAGFDKRVFQDGIYITSKDGKEIK
jgi:large subunit ribosomal protein L6